MIDTIDYNTLDPKVIFSKYVLTNTPVVIKQSM